MLDYKIYDDSVTLYLNNGRVVPIYFTPDTGEVYYRMKIDTISNVKHKGIFLGVDENDKGYFIHNHHEARRATIVSTRKFTKGQAIYHTGESCENPPEVVIEIALNKVLDKEPYDFALYNCQTLTNEACHNERKSESVNAWVDGFKIVAVIALAIGAIGAIAVAAGRR